MSETPSVDELDALSTEDLRERAFRLAENRHDIGFFWDLLKHLRPTADIAHEDGSSGHITGGIADAVEAVRELVTGHLGNDEPFVRARFIDYIRRNSATA
jgi:hypothetical protein